MVTLTTSTLFPHRHPCCRESGCLHTIPCIPGAQNSRANADEQFIKSVDRGKAELNFFEQESKETKKQERQNDRKEGRKETRKEDRRTEGRKEEIKKGRKEGRKEGKKKERKKERKTLK